MECRILAVHENQYDRGVWVSIDPCPFYGRGGGQAGDIGVLRWTDDTRGGVEQAAVVVATERPYRNGLALLLDFVGSGSAADVDDESVFNIASLREGLVVRARVDQQHRASCSVHHSATHLLNAALREALGAHVTQVRLIPMLFCGDGWFIGQLHLLIAKVQSVLVLCCL